METEAQKRVREWMETWAPHCGASRAVFEGQFRAILTVILEDIADRISVKTEATALRYVPKKK